MAWKKGNPGCPACGVQCWTVTEEAVTRNVFDSLPTTLYAKLHLTAGTFASDLSDLPVDYRRNYHKYDGEPNEIPPVVIDITAYILAWFALPFEITFSPTDPEEDPCAYTAGVWATDAASGTFSFTLTTLPGGKETTVCFPFQTGSQYQAISNFDVDAWADAVVGITLPGSLLPPFAWGNSVGAPGAGVDGDLCNLWNCNYDDCDTIPIGGYVGVTSEYELNWGPAQGTAEFDCAALSIDFSAFAPNYLDAGAITWEVTDVANPCGGLDITHVTDIEIIHAVQGLAASPTGLDISFNGLFADDPLDQWDITEFPLPLSELPNIKFHFDRVAIDYEATAGGGRSVSFPNSAPDDSATIVQWWAFDPEYQSLAEWVDFEGTELDENADYPCGPSGATLPAPFVDPAGFKVIEKPYVVFGCKLTGVHATLQVAPDPPAPPAEDGGYTSAFFKFAQSIYNLFFE
jgi:hypothetical protein